ncbi:MAG: PrsW family glutamic-type intramembrane protease [Ignavibacteria bacterium]|nr:PrsW family glutamic-type intramembrane protease [Ignavibacteria bacterium]
MDTFKLLKPIIILYAILWGIISAVIAYPINNILFTYFNQYLVTGIAAPIIEETLKFSIVIYMFYKNRLGFLADSLIIGFAVGAGFSLVENVYYFNQLGEQNLMLWIIRGFGTAIMHGTATGIAAVVSQNFIGKKLKMRLDYLLYGLLSGILIHSIFNNFLLSPLLQTLLQISLLPIFIIVVFSKSESSLKSWLVEQFDSEVNLLLMIKKGEFKTTRAGEYLISIKERFPQEVLVDILGYIKIYLELSIKAKGILLMKEAGFDVNKDDELKAQIQELKALSKSIGATGLITLSPILKTNKKDLWKMNHLFSEIK